MNLESRKGTPAGALVTPLFWSGGYVPATPERRSRPGVFLRESIRAAAASKRHQAGQWVNPQTVNQCQEIWAWIEYKVAKSVH